MGGKTGESVFLSAEGLLWLNKTARDPQFHADGGDDAVIRRELCGFMA